ncbi:MAG: lipoyl synthase [Candidatus Omnitrophota bacterium]
MKNRLPPWFRQDIPDAQVLERMRLFSRLNVHTVCQEAKCPNSSHCFKNLEFTFVILGDICTRSCRFCAVKKSGILLRLGQELVLPVDLGEPDKISRIVRLFKLNYVVITSVTRDDLADGGAGQFAKTIELIRAIDKNIKIEVLVPDFSSNSQSLKTVIEAKPSIFAHNIETIARLYKTLRPKAGYQASLDILSRSKVISPSLITKSSLMLGLGEKEAEVLETMQDLRRSHCDILMLGQYLAPSPGHYPVKEFISMEQFTEYRKRALALGFKGVSSGPKVRSSYQAEKVYREVQYA